MYVYIELLRRVAATEIDKEGSQEQFPAQFAMLGSYDALYSSISEINSINDLKKHFEQRQLNLPWQYDRQPLFLYTNDSVEHIERLFSIADSYADKPLIFSQFHVNKVLLSQHESLDEIISGINKHINDLKECIGCSSTLEFSVLANFGVADIVVVFRDFIIDNIIELIHKLRMNDIISDKINIISMCSYMAFPLERNSTLRRAAIQTWVEREKNFNSAISINTLYETSSHSKAIGAVPDTYFQLGEWDFLLNLPQNDYNSIANHISQLIDDLVSNGVNTYASTYTSVTMHMEEHTNPADDDIPVVRIISPTPIELIKQELSNISLLLNSHSNIVENRNQEITATLASVKASITGIINYVNRLCVGHCQDDIRAYVIRFFELLPPVLASYRNQIETEINMKHPEQVQLLVNDLLNYNAEFVTAFQHLFAVFSVTPHTFIETFGCNMRSLAASSKLLCAYQSLVLTLAEKFPDTLFADKYTHIKVASHQMLILPYRKMQSTHRLLYPLSSPFCRLSTISLDYSTMFNIQPTLFMLVHECGHHVGPRLRQPRSVYIAQAVFRALLYRYFGRFIESPLDEIVNYSFPQGVSDVTEENNPLSFGITEEEYKLRVVAPFSQSIRKIASNIICEYADQLAANFHDWYTDINKPEINFDKVNHIAVLNHFVSQLVQALGESIEIQLCFTDSKRHYGSFSDESLKLAQYYLGKFHGQVHEILRDVARTINDLNGNTRTSARLQADYLLLSEVSGTIDNFTTAMNIGRLENDELSMIVSVFRDTFADLFAITILSCTMQDYVSTIPALFCTQINQIVTDPAILLRIMAVCKVAFGTDNIDNILKPLALPGDTLSAIRGVWENQLVRFPAKEPLIEYAQHCYDRLKEDVQKVEEDIEISSIREFFSSQITEETEVSFVFSLWKQLMAEGGK